MEWQPIETAPKDRTILVYGQPSNLKVNGDVLVTYRAPLVCTAAWDELDDAYVVTGGSWLGPFVDPTHWMPLPKPPIDHANES